MPAPILKDGDRLGAGNRFRVHGSRPVGQGQFAEVFRAVDEKALPDRDRDGSSDGGAAYVAVKIEREDKTSTRERRALQDLQGCKGVVEFIAHGTANGKLNPYIVMQLVGDNLADVRRDRLGHMSHRHSLGTVGWIGAQMLDILEGMHGRGYVHRDVKPSNVTLGGGGGSGAARRSDSRTLYLIDLGLAKKFDTAPGVGGGSGPGAFRGSTTYASVNAHAGEEQGPRDDLWSLLYMLAECHEVGRDDNRSTRAALRRTPHQNKNKTQQIQSSFREHRSVFIYLFGF